MVEERTKKIISKMANITLTESILFNKHGLLCMFLLLQLFAVLAAYVCTALICFVPVLSVTALVVWV